MGYDLKILIYSLACGGLMGLIYEFFRIVRATLFPFELKQKKEEKRQLPSTSAETDILLRDGSGLRYSASGIFTAVCDVLFLTVCGISAAILIFHTNDGEIRWFALAGCGVGFAIYMLTAGRIILRVYLKTKSFVFKVVKKTVTLLLAPVTIPAKAVIKRIKKRRIRSKARRTLLNMLKESKEKDERDTSESDNGEGEGAVSEG